MPIVMLEEGFVICMGKSEFRPECVENRYDINMCRGCWIIREIIAEGEKVCTENKDSNLNFPVRRQEPYQIRPFSVIKGRGPEPGRTWWTVPAHWGKTKES